MNTEQIIFTIILHAGNARSECFEALRLARDNDFVEAEACMEKAQNELTAAHRVQTSMLQEEANGTQQEINLLMIHAQDHLMCAMLARDMVKQMLPLFEMQMNLQKALQSQGCTAG